MKIKIFGKEINAFVLIFSAIALTAMAMLLRVYMPKNENFDKYENSSNQSQIVSQGQQSGEGPQNPIDFESLQKENPDVCAWIKVDGTEINYPVVQSGKDKPEDYYLSHEWTGAKKTAGSVYIQKLNNNDFSDRNTVIYAHDTYNGTMFGPLKKFRDKSFFEQNRKITLYRKGHIMEYEIYSAFVFGDQHIMYAYDFSTDSGYEKFLSQTLNPDSKVKNVLPDAKVSVTDKIITLSTCTLKEGERYLIAAVLKNDIITQ